MRFFKTIARRALPTALATLAVAAAAHAQSFLDLAVTPGAQSVAPGAAPFWNVQLTNNNAEAAFFVIVGFNDGLGSNADISVPAYDPTPFGVPQTLEPGASLTLSSFFQTIVAPTASPAIYTNLAEMTYDLYLDNSFGTVDTPGAVASGEWQLSVSSGGTAAPEPSALALVGFGGLLGGALARRRR